MDFVVDQLRNYTNQLDDASRYDDILEIARVSAQKPPNFNVLICRLFRKFFISK